jgi:hypothetical protein
MQDNEADQLIQDIELFLGRPFSDFTDDDAEFPRLHQEALNKRARLTNLPLSRVHKQKLENLSQRLDVHRQKRREWQKSSNQLLLPPVIPEPPTEPEPLQSLFEHTTLPPADAVTTPTRRTNLSLFVMSAVFVLTGLITFIAVFLVLTHDTFSDNNAIAIELTTLPTYTPVILVVTATPETEGVVLDSDPQENIFVDDPTEEATRNKEVPPTRKPEIEPTPTRMPVPRRIEPPSIISRSAWGATAPDGSDGNQVPYQILLSHDGQDTQGVDPVVLIQRIQRNHQERWVDIAWHYIIDLDGNIYEGRNPHERTNSGYIPNTDGMIVIGLLGDYDTQVPSQRQIDAIVSLMAWLCDRYSISPGEIYPFRDFAQQTDPDITSPGRNFNMNNIRRQVEARLEQR